jgi:tetrapyrrole methylase family protein/MazG family protein
MTQKEKMPLYKLQDIASVLRSEKGCAWDKKQTFSSLKPYLIEEAYEVYDAIDKNDAENLREELGDLLYQIYAHSQIASELGLFDIDDVAEGISSKLIRRHPHVFGDENITDSDKVKARWEEIKKSEKTERESILDGIPPHLPALIKAYRVQEKVSHVGFDWEKAEDAAAKIDEEVEEFREALKTGDKSRITEEAGDALFSIINVMRLSGIDAEDALRKTIDKFITRFRYIERESARESRNLDKMSLEEMENLWQKAKSVS